MFYFSLILLFLKQKHKINTKNKIHNVIITAKRILFILYSKKKIKYYKKKNWIRDLEFFPKRLTPLGISIEKLFSN